MQNTNDPHGGQPFTTAPVAAPAKTAIQPTLPEWIRPPTRGLCPWTGLSRAKLYQLITPCEANRHKPPVKSVCLRKQGALKGARLISLRSLLDYLNAQADAQSQEHAE